jgi:hypothetical protein
MDYGGNDNGQGDIGYSSGQSSFDICNGFDYGKKEVMMVG